MSLVFRAISEPEPGPRWQALFAEAWPGYESWFLREGESRRPTYGESLKMLKRHLPELVPIYDKLVALAGGGDRQARLLSLWCPTPFLSGCSQAVFPSADSILVRNYDYSPALCDAVLLYTRWGEKAVIASSDCLWGVLDGVNEDGLVVSLAFGGRTVVGEGFGIPLVLRYVLQLCTTTREAAEVLGRVPVNMAYNVTVLDASGDFVTAFLAPDRPAELRRWPIATNHQGAIEWREHAAATKTLERESFLAARLSDPGETAERMVARFLEPPLYSTRWAHGWGTLYTAAYQPRERRVTLLWPGQRLEESIAAFHEVSLPVQFGEDAVRWSAT